MLTPSKVHNVDGGLTPAQREYFELSFVWQEIGALIPIRKAARGCKGLVLQMPLEEPPVLLLKQLSCTGAFCRAPWNYRIIRAGKDLPDQRVQPLTNPTMVPKSRNATFTCLLNTSGMVTPPLPWALPVSDHTFSFLISNLNLPCCPCLSLERRDQQPQGLRELCRTCHMVHVCSQQPRVPVHNSGSLKVLVVQRFNSKKALLFSTAPKSCTLQ